MNKAMLLAVSVLVTACGGGGGYDSGGCSSTPAGLTYTIGGMVSGLNAGGAVVLQNNGGNNLSVTQNGAFTYGVGAYPGMSGVTNVAVTCR